MAHKPSNKIWFEREIPKAEAFLSLKGPSPIVYLLFRARVKVQQLRGRGGKKEWVIINNGEIEFTYSEAEKMGFTRPRFTRAIDELVEKGFIDIAHSGSGGVKGDKSLYAISERWRNYGTAEFVKKTRPKDPRQGRGFAVRWKGKRGEQQESEEEGKVIELVKRRIIASQDKKIKIPKVIIRNKA